MNFSIIGGDLRTVKLSQMLSKENEVNTYGLENSNEIKNDIQIKKCDTLEETIRASKYIIAPLPLSKDGKYINSPYSNSKIEIQKIITLLNKENIFIAGAINEPICKNLRDKNIKVIDLMKQEELTVLNTIATAEGTIEIAIQNTDINLQGSNILILGFGRVAKTVAKKFKALDAIVTCAARKEEDLAWIQTLGYKEKNINNLKEDLDQYDIIINTVPQIILTEKKLRYINNKALIIDLASKPGGVDFEKAKEIGIKTIWALALPGKVSPLTSAKFIKKTINKILKEEIN